MLEHEVRRFHNGIGLDWLARLPDILAECERRWSLAIGEPVSYASLSFVAPAIRADGAELVLKVGFLGDGLASEVAALRVFDGRGAVMLVDAAPELGAILLERLRPGTMLATLDDDREATSAAVGVMRELWRAPPPDLPCPTLMEWTDGFRTLREQFDGGTGPLPCDLVATAQAYREELLADPLDPVLMHGDLQHYNILRAERRPWLAIDPKGVVGDPGFEVGPFMANRLEGAADPTQLIARRLEQFADELAMDRERLRRWAFVSAVLSAWWSIEDTGEGWQGAIECAGILAALRVRAKG
jgi:streptomycin 6-kinase